MGKVNKTEEIVFLFENYNSDSEKLHTSFKMAGMNYPAAVIDDDGFLPDGVESVYGFFLGDNNSENTGKARYFNEINIPDYWEIRANNSEGKIYEYNKMRGRIFYTKPTNKRLVKIVDWYDEKGIVRSSDHYNKNGILYARTIFDSKGKKINKAYFSANGKEIIVENYVTKDIILNEDKTIRIFNSKTELVCYYLEKKGYTESKLYYNTLSVPFFVSQTLRGHKMGDVLFWQEKSRENIPGNMKVILEQKNTRTEKVIVLNKNAYENLIKAGADAQIVKSLGYIYNFKKKNNHRTEALICTNSENIACCTELINAIPEMNFTIVAVTEMSSKLLGLEKYDNVTLFPNVKPKQLDVLFNKCDYYLDINYESEIVSAVETAFMHNHLIFAFNETIHNREYIADENIYGKAEYQSMVNEIKKIMQDKSLLNKKIEIQHKAAGISKKEEYMF